MFGAIRVKGKNYSSQATLRVMALIIIIIIIILSYFFVGEGVFKKVSAWPAHLRSLLMDYKQIKWIDIRRWSGSALFKIYLSFIKLCSLLLSNG